MHQGITADTRGQSLDCGANQLAETASGITRALQLAITELVKTTWSRTGFTHCLVCRGAVPSLYVAGSPLRLICGSCQGTWNLRQYIAAALKLSDEAAHDLIAAAVFGQVAP